MRNKMKVLLACALFCVIGGIGACSPNEAKPTNKKPSPPTVDITNAYLEEGAALRQDKSGLFSVSSGISSVTYGQPIPEKYAKLPDYAYAKTGVRFDTNTSGSWVLYNNVVDLDEVKGNLFTFEVPYGETSNISQITVEMIDIYDASKTIAVDWTILHDNGFVTYTTVSCNTVVGSGNNDDRANFGAIRLQYGTTNYMSNFQEKIFWEGDAWQAAGYQLKHEPFHVRYNNEEMELRASVGYDTDMSDFLLLDVNSPLMMGENIFEGFTTGEVYLRLKFTSITSAGAVVLTSIGGKDLSAETLVKEPSNFIKIDFEKEEYSDKMPCGKVGVAYPLPKAIEKDVFFGDVIVNRMVHNAEGKTMPIENDTFTPNEAGKYELTFVSTDVNGLIVYRKYPITVLSGMDLISITEVFKQEKYYATDKSVLPMAQAQGGSGILDVETSYMFNGEKISPNNIGQYVFEGIGELEMNIKAVDYLGEVKTQSFTYEVFNNPTLKLRGSLPKGFLAGTTVMLPDFEVIDYADIDYSSKTVIVNGVELGEGRMFTVPENGMVTVKYVAAAGTQNEVSYTEEIPVLGTLKINETEQDLTPLFVGSGNTTITQVDGGVEFTASDDNNGVTFANSLSAAMTELYFRPTSSKGYEYLEVTLTDALDESISISFRVYNVAILTNAFRVQDENGDYDYYKYKLSMNISETERFHFFYDNNAKAIYNVNVLKIADIHYDRNGAEFNGFSSGMLNVSVRLGGVKTASSFVIRQFGNQQFTKDAVKYGDIIGPQLAPKSWLESGNIDVGSDFVVPEALAVDVLSSGVSISVSLTSPKGEKLLDSADCSRSYSVKFNQLGNYKLVYVMEDSNGSISQVQYIYVSVDRMAPEMVISGNYKTEYALGESVKLLSISATDNVDGESALKTYTVIVSPDHAYLKGISGETFTFTIAGLYKIRHCAYDLSGNITVVEFEITVS